MLSRAANCVHASARLDAVIFSHTVWDRVVVSARHNRIFACAVSAFAMACETFVMILAVLVLPTSSSADSSVRYCFCVELC